jgi:PleD family two-component response regulator
MTMPPQEKAPLSATLTEHGITVLLVDDQAIVAAAVKRMLETETDISFHYCQDPNQALQKALEVSPTVILQDLVMPDIDGLTLVRFFRGHPRLKNIPLIVLSTREEAATKAEAFALGANDYLVKLPDRIELIARIRYHSAGYINLLQRNEAYEALLESQQALASELALAQPLPRAPFRPAGAISRPPNSAATVSATTGSTKTILPCICWMFAATGSAPPCCPSQR